MQFQRSELIHRLSDIFRKGWTNQNLRDLIDSLWRDPFINRNSGFNIAGGTDSVINFDDVTRTFSVAPVNNRFAFWQFISQISYFKRTEAMEVQLPDEEGLYLIYIFRDEADKTRKLQKLFYIKNPTENEIKEVYLNRVIVSFLYWDATAGEALHFGDDRHGSEWNPHIHLYLHNAFHARRKSGLTLTGMSINGDGSADAHAKFSVTGGVMLHDDFELTIAASSETIPVLYQLGTTPRFLETAGYGIYKGAWRVCYNTGGAAVEATSGYHVLYHIFATNEIGTASRKIISVMGAGQYEKLAAAYYAVDSELETIAAWIPQQGRFYVGTVVFQTADEYTNTMAARVVGVVGEQSKTHSPVTIAPASAGLASIDENQELSILITFPLQVTSITLLSASWTLVSGLYEYDLGNANITANSVVDVIPENADIDIVKTAEILPKTVSSAGSVKLYATNAPTGNIGVTIIITEATS